MPAKKRNSSPAKVREAARAAAEGQDAPQRMPTWPKWETKVDKVKGRSCVDILRGWLAHVPDIGPAGSPPREGIGTIFAIDAILPSVPITGDLVTPISGARSGVLHEAYYLLHKAIYVQITCAQSVRAGLHTWAVVDAYQASLFALSSLMCFLGITIERDGSDFILIDVWGASSPDEIRKQGLRGEGEVYQFVRFKTLDHFHKWALLKRMLRTLDGNFPLIVLLSEAINGRDDKDFARHRNRVHYDSDGWLASDLLQPDHGDFVKQAQSPQGLFEEILAGSPSGTVYLMCALIELASQFANELRGSGILAEEHTLLDRRRSAVERLIGFDWTAI